MSWWQRFTRGARRARLSIDPAQLPMPGWELVRREPAAAYWRDAMGDVASLTLGSGDPGMPPLSDRTALQRYCRHIAERQGAGLVEVVTAVGAEGPSLTYIYKRLRKPAFTVFGVVTTPMTQGSWTWMVIAAERGSTGVREAVITAKLLEAGQLTLESYKASWAQDPYEPAYSGVERSTLRYLSDAEEYDAEFPDHPLTKVRRELRRLLGIHLAPITAA
jgi:hypothetical protein